MDNKQQLEKELELTLDTIKSMVCSNGIINVKKLRFYVDELESLYKDLNLLY